MFQYSLVSLAAWRLGPGQTETADRPTACLTELGTQLWGFAKGLDGTAGGLHPDLGHRGKPPSAQASTEPRGSLAGSLGCGVAHGADDLVSLCNERGPGKLAACGCTQLTGH